MNDEKTRRIAAQYVSDWPSSNEDEWREAAMIRKITNVDLFVQTAAQVQEFKRRASAKKFQSDVDQIWKD